MVRVDGHPAEHAWRLSRFLVISGHRLTGAIHGRIVGSVAEKHGEVVRFARGGMDALSITGVGRGRSTSPEVGLTNMALKRGISHISVRRRLGRGEVGGREGINGRVACLIARDVGSETIRVV